MALDIFDVIQTVDREKIALKLKKYLEEKTDIEKKIFYTSQYWGRKAKSGMMKNTHNSFLNGALTI